MTLNRIALFSALVVSWWIIAHLIYAFAVLDWSLFTEWHPASRAVNLIISFYCCGLATWFVTKRSAK